MLTILSKKFVFLGEEIQMYKSSDRLLQTCNSTICTWPLAPITTIKTLKDPWLSSFRPRNKQKSCSATLQILFGSRSHVMDGHTLTNPALY